jgi:16S rRNA processing protein RimM
VTGRQRVAIGRIVGAHGLRGRVRVRSFDAGPENLLQASSVTLGKSEEDPKAVSAKVVGAEPGRSGEVRMALAGVDGREAASRLQGRLVMVDAGQLEQLPDGEYYEFQLVGCRVEGAEGQTIGAVREVWSTGAGGLLVVESEAGEQRLIPTGGDFLREVDLEGRRIVIEVIPGLLDAP